MATHGKRSTFACFFFFFFFFFGAFFFRPRLEAIPESGMSKAIMCHWWTCVCFVCDLLLPFFGGRINMIAGVLFYLFFWVVYVIVYS